MMMTFIRLWDNVEHSKGPEDINKISGENSEIDS